MATTQNEAPRREQHPFPEPVYSEIPGSLKALDQWVLWKAVWGKDKWQKVPIAATGRSASSTDPATWTDFGTAVAESNARHPQLAAGLGFVFTSDDPYVGVDLDDARDPGTGEPLDWAAPILDRFKGTYTEVSPSLTGYKIFCRGEKQFQRASKKYGDGEVECYNQKRYFTLTGIKHGTAAEVSDCQEALDWLGETVFAAGKRDKRKNKPGCWGKIPDGDRNNESIRRLGVLQAKGYPDNEIRRQAHTWGCDPEAIDRRIDWMLSKEKGGGFDTSKVSQGMLEGEGGSFKLLAKDDLDPELSARGFLEVIFGHKRDADPLDLQLRYHREQFYEFQGNRYSPISTDSVRSAILLYLQDGFAMVKAKDASDVLAHVRALTHVNDLSPMPAWIEGKSRMGAMKTSAARRLTSVKNGLVDVEAIISGKGEPLLRHHPQWFSEVCLPFDYDPAATCPTWERIVSQNLDHEVELVAVIQEFFGLCLTTSTDLHSFLLCYGDGGTGKSATMGALRALLGDANVSSVPLVRLSHFSKGS